LCPDISLALTESLHFHIGSLTRWYDALAAHRCHILPPSPRTMWRTRLGRPCAGEV
jgi:hypothetical protein